MTVGDKIRKMSDEQLAELLLGVAFENSTVDQDNKLNIPSPFGGYLAMDKEFCDVKDVVKELKEDAPEEDMTSSHNEKAIYEGCISLMEDLVDSFYEYLDFIGIDVNEQEEDEQFSKNFHPAEIVERLFLARTTHGGGTSQRMKCLELGIDPDKRVVLTLQNSRK